MQNASYIGKGAILGEFCKRGFIEFSIKLWDIIIFFGLTALICIVLDKRGFICTFAECAGHAG